MRIDDRVQMQMDKDLSCSHGKPKLHLSQGMARWGPMKIIMRI